MPATESLVQSNIDNAFISQPSTGGWEFFIGNFLTHFYFPDEELCGTIIYSKCRETKRSSMIRDWFMSKETRKLLAAMDKIAAGDLTEVDESSFKRKDYAARLNGIIRAFKKGNNGYVMRMNDTVEALGNNALIKETFDQVNLLTGSIRDMKVSSSAMENSIQDISHSMGDIKKHTHEVLATYQVIVPNMEHSIQMISDSSSQVQSLNEQMQYFSESIKKIGEIIEMVKKIAFQSNILSLNASIEAGKAGEAGKGFAVVATEMRQLSLDTTKSAEHIEEYIEKISAVTKELADSMNVTAKNLEDGNSKAVMSMQDMVQMNSQITEINAQVDNVFEAIGTQSEATGTFLIQIDNISERYDKLSDDCVKLGKHIFKIGRYVDKTRSDMVRYSSDISVIDWLRVYQVDHYIFTWRIYNNIVGFESLRREQVDNPSGCKLGKWLAAQTDTRIINSKEFMELQKKHINIHKYATLSWEAKKDGDDELAMMNFNHTYAAFLEFNIAYGHFKTYMQKLGYTDKTDIDSFIN